MFVKIVAMHSELVCLDKEGNLYQWKWEDPGPFPSERGSKLTHPKTKSLVTLELALILWKQEPVTT